MALEPDQLIGHLDRLHRYALGVTHDPHLAADVVQDTMLRALERGGQYRGDAPLGHWLIRIAHNLAIDRARRSGREVAVDLVEADWRDDTYSVDAEAVVERAATRDDLLDALVRLPFIYRSAVVLHDIEGLKVAEVARIQEISLPAAKQRLRRGRMALVNALADGNDRRQALKGVPLRCWDARQQVSDYLDGELEPAAATMVEAHLATCPTCPPLYAALVGVQAHLGRLRDPDTVVSPDLEARIRDALRSG